MTDVSTTPVNGVAHPQLVSQHEALSSAQPAAIKRKRVDGSGDEAQMNGNAPREALHSASGASIQEQIADFIIVLKK